MSDTIANSTDNREIMGAPGIKMQTNNEKMELVSNANLVHEEIDLVEKYYAGYTDIRGNVMIVGLNCIICQGT